MSMSSVPSRRRRGRSKLWLPARFATPYAPDPVPVSDTFTDTNGVELRAHTPEVGGPWIKHPLSGAGDPAIHNGRIHHETGGTGLVIATAVPSTADYDVSADFILVTDNNSSNSGVAGRVDPAANTCVTVRYNTATDSFELLELVAGVGGSVTSFAAPVTGQRGTLRLRGSRAAVLVDGVEVASMTTTVLGAGRAGVRMGGTSGPTVGVHLGNFAVTEAGKLSWRRPDTTGWTEVHVGGSTGTVDGGDGTTDAVIIFDSPVTAVGGLSVNNYRNVVIDRGEIDARGLAAGRTAAQMRGAAFTAIRGHIYVEGLLQRGTAAASGIAGALGDGFVFNNITTGLRKTLITLQNCRTENARAEALDQQLGVGAYVGSEMHPDWIQLFGGQNGYGLRIDKSTAQTPYQGLFNQSGSKPAMDLRRVNIDGTTAGVCYDGVTPVSTILYYASSNNTLPQRISCRDCYAKSHRTPSAYLSHPGSIGAGFASRSFGDVIDGSPELGDWCPSGVAGMDYVSPGYQQG